MIEITGETGHRDCRDQLQWQFFLRLSCYRTQSQYDHANIQRWWHFIPKEMLLIARA
jgi:hypothetical protein